MKSKFKVFEKISNSSLIIFIAFIIFFKVLVYIFLESKFLSFTLGGGSDANYYHAYAEGLTNVAVNTWPVFLRYLNNIGLYSRDTIAYLLFFLSLLVMPILVCKLAGLRFYTNQKYYLYGLLFCSIYPTLYFYSLDVYRDVFMVFVFLVGCMIVKRCLSSTHFLYSIFYFILSIILGVYLLGLRPYLGYAFLLSLFLWNIKFTKKRLVFLSALYLLVLFIANYIGALESLTEYRSGFEEGSGSTLGLNFSNPILFIPNFILSFFGQMLGLYITNPLAVILLLLETTPFFFMLLYVIKNIKLADSFVRFLIIFFMIYASVWLIGNDNLGTAVRLRLYNYLAIYISFFYILRLKSLSQSNLQAIRP